MLKNAQDDVGSGSGVTRLKLARGSFNSESPSRSLSTPSASHSVGGSVGQLSVTPETPEKGNGMQVLSQLGIAELLEQDERAAFIVDLGQDANYSPGHLQVLFMNAALRACPGLVGMITGKADRDSPGIVAPSTFHEFKIWVMSLAKVKQSTDAHLFQFIYGGMTWTRSTLRKRLRVISGSFNAHSSSFRSNPSSPDLQNSKADRKGFLPEATIPEERAHVDYFGPGALSSDHAGADIDKGEVMSITDSPDSKLFLPNEPITPSSLHGGSGFADSHPFPNSNASKPLSSEGPLDLLSLGKFADVAYFDWTRLPISPAMPKHIQFAKSVDWASTELGPMESWSPTLRLMCNLIMASPHPAAMYWGNTNIAIYNESYIHIAGRKHPELMGQSYNEAWPEIWDEIKGVFEEAKTSGLSTMKADDCLMLNRNGFVEETYFSWSIIPIVGDSGAISGLYNPCFEHTKRKVAERRMLTLREIGERMATARDTKNFWKQVLKGLDYNPEDTPFVLLYSIATDDQSGESETSSIQSSSLKATKQCLLEGSLGVPEGHDAAPLILDPNTDDSGWCSYFKASMKDGTHIVLDVEKGTLAPSLLDGIEFRGFGERCRSVVISPVQPTTDDSVLGFLVMGINPRRPYDDEYDLFVQLLTRQLATAMASVVLFEEEIRRGERAAKLAAIDRMELHEQLAARTQEAVDSETKFTRMAEFAPVGMFIANSEGKLTFCNDTWYKITGHPRDGHHGLNWMDSVKDEDREIVEEMWNKLINKKEPANREFRFKVSWEARNGSAKGDTWVLASAYPEKAENGSLKSVFGSITNISQQKWAEDFQKQRTEEAVEMKRQQENFIDTTSHEMRNPLSAILQCADEISTTLSSLRSESNHNSGPSAELVDSSIDAAQTIALCAQHQKRIVDDVLTLSKLDGALLLVTPVDVKPVSVVQRALRMFEGELETHDIEVNFTINKTYTDLNIDWVRMDPSRLMQVLINLITNAIKFTQGEPTRKITMLIGAGLNAPSDKDKPCVTYFPTRSKKKDLTQDPEWGEGEQVYLQFGVTDTGRGLDEQEKKVLFQRFAQSSPRTHVQYGGSGLGLFISRQLVELQAGEIGVSSESGIGSTFAFYIKVRRSNPPDGAADYLPSDHPRKTSIPKRPLARAGPSGSFTKEEISPGPDSVPLKAAEPIVNLSNLKILIVEDNLVNQRVLQKQLKNLGCAVAVANHGGEALAYLQTTRFWKGKTQSEGVELSVVLMDLEMPVMDGLTCTRKIRNLEAAGEVVGHVPIIAVTANARSGQIETALKAGMDDVVSKPFRIPELIPKIQDAMTEHGQLDPIDTREAPKEGKTAEARP